MAYNQQVSNSIVLSPPRTLYDADIVGSAIITNGAYVGNCKFNSGTLLNMKTSGQANNIILNGGNLSMTEAGFVTSLVMSSGDADIYAGYANSVTISGGKLTVGDTGYITNVTVSNGGHLALSNNNVSNSGITISSGGALDVYDANNTLSNVNFTSGSILNLYNGYVYNDGTVSANLSHNRVLTVNGSAQANNLTINNATMKAQSGASVNNISLSQNGKLIVDGKNTAAYKTSLNGSGAKLVVSNNAQAAGVTAYEGSIEVTSGKILNATLTNNALMTVNNQGYLLGGLIVNGAQLTVSSGGTTYETTLTSGGTQTIAIKGKTSNTIIGDGGVLTFMPSPPTIGGTAEGTIISSGGILSVLKGGTANGTVIMAGGELQISAGGNVSGTIVSSGATLGVSPDVTVYNTTVSSGATLTVSNNGTASNTIIESDGKQILMPGGTAVNTTINDGGVLTVNPNATASNTTIANGGTMVVNAGATLDGDTILNAGGNLTIYTNNGGTVTLSGDGYHNLIINGLNSNGGTVSTEIKGYKGTSFGNSDVITLEGIKPSDIKSVDYKDANGEDSKNYVTFTLQNGNKITLYIDGVGDHEFELGTSSDGSLTFQVCFLAGSLIRTPNGDVAVEDIRIGDEVIVYDWKNNRNVISTIKWVGSTLCEVRHSEYDDQAGDPVRVLKDAIAEGVPYKDLLITSEHCLFFGDKFIPVRMLVNGASIFYDKSFTSYTYYHIETEQHSVIYADGMLRESYLDTGNRRNFYQHGSVVLFNQAGSVKNWQDDANAQLATDRETVEAIYNQIV